jgi:acetyltransferase-like isoleucine patch superfamily enzyme
LETGAEQPQFPGLLTRMRRAWARDTHLGVNRRIRKGIAVARQLLRAHFALRGCTRVGLSPRVAGRMRVDNHGVIVIGDYLNIKSSWVPTELITGRDGRIEIGNDVAINYGTVIAAGKGVTIGSRTMLGQHCIISDLDIPETAVEPGPGAPNPITIGKDVWLAARVTVRPGVTIGDGAVVVAGSIVESDVPAHAMASGIPARLLPKLATVAQPGNSGDAASGPVVASVERSANETVGTAAPVRHGPCGGRARSGAGTVRVGRLAERVRAIFHQDWFSRVGRGTVIAGVPTVINDGVIQIGEGCLISSRPIQSHFVTMPGAVITIGGGVLISYGAAISAMRAITIGDDTRIGPFCVILDVDYHEIGDRDSHGAVAPVQIGRYVTIGARCTVLRGARIGDGAQVMSGSTVSGIVASGAVVAGVPARVAGLGSAAPSVEVVAAIVMRVWGLTKLPGDQDGPAQIPAWTAIGCVQLRLALEETLGFTLPEEEIRRARSIADVAGVVARAREASRETLA